MNILKLGNILIMVKDKIYITDGRAIRFVRVALFFFIELICRIKKNCYLDIIGISETPQQKYFKNFIELVWSIQK